MDTKPALTISGLFADDAKTIAESLGSSGPAIGIRVLAFYISHAGRGMSPARRKNLDKAKEILSAQIKREL